MLDSMDKINNKGRILFLLQYIYQNTDEEHPVTTNVLIAVLSEVGYIANRKTIKNDINVLEAAGFDIITVKSSGNLFFYGSRSFELPELKLLIDAVSSSKFIILSKSKQLIQKLSTFTSKYQAEQLTQRIYTKDRIKADNGQIYYIVDCLSDAIQRGQKVRYQYTDYTPDKEKILRNDGEFYINSPYALLWNEDFYYLIGYSEKRGKIITFRVDRILSPEILEESVVSEPEDFNVADFAKKVFEMYDGDEQEVELICDNELMKTIIDRFGEEVSTERVSEKQFRATVRVSTSRTFYGWVFQFAGQMRITAPDVVKQEYVNMARNAIEE